MPSRDGASAGRGRRRFRGRGRGGRRRRARAPRGHPPPHQPPGDGRCPRRSRPAPARGAGGDGAGPRATGPAAGDRCPRVTARRLVVTADDFGAAPEVNAAVVRAHREGILTSTSLMVTGDAVDEAVRLARETPTLAVGLHLVLAQGRPAAPRAEIPDLVAEDGAFRRAPISTGLRYAWQYLSSTGRAQLRREIEAQLAAFAATGLRLSHVDGHLNTLNMHLHPMVLPILRELAPRYGIRAMRLSREDLPPALLFDPSLLP